MPGSDRSSGRKRRKRLRVLVVLLLVGTALYGAFGLYPAATLELIGKWVLASRGVTPAAFEITDVGLGTLVVEDIRLGPGPDLAIARLQVDYSLADLMRRRVKRLVIEEPRLAGRIGPGETISELAASFSLGVVDRLIGGSDTEPGATPAPWPELQLSGGRFRLTTPIGDIDSEFDAESAPDGAGKGHVALLPTRLASDTAALDVSSLAAAFERKADGTVHTEIDIDVPKISSADYLVEGVSLDAEYDGDERSGGGSIAVGIAQLRLAEREIDDIYGALPEGLRLTLEEDAFRAFAESIGGEVRRALADAGLDWRARLSRDADGLHVLADAPLRLTAPTGAGGDEAKTVLHVALAATAPDRPLLSWGEGRKAQIAGTLSVDGASLPHFGVEWDGDVEFALGAGLALPSIEFIDFDAVRLNLEPWTVGERRLALDDLSIGIKSNRVTSLGDISGSLVWNGPAVSGLALTNSRLSLDGRYRYENDRLSYHQRGGGCATLESEEIQLEEFALHRSQVQMCAKEEEPLLRVLFNRGQRTELQLNMHVAPGYASLDGPSGLRLRGLFPELDLYSEYLPAEGDWRLTFGLFNGALLLPEDGGSIVDLRLTGLASARTGMALEVEAGLDGLTLRDPLAAARYAPLSFTGSIHVSNDQARFEGEAKSASGLKLADISAEHRLTEETGFMRVESGEFTFEPNSLQPQTLLPVLSGVVANVKGKVAAAGEFAWTGDGLSSAGSLTLADVGFISRIAFLSGLNANIALSSLLPLATPGTQFVEIENADVGVDLEDVKIAFNFDPEIGMILEEARWPWSGGTIGFNRTVLSFDQPVQKVELTAADIDIHQVFTLLDVEGLDGTGVAAGILPLAVGESSIIVQNGRLVSEKGGTLRYTGPIGGAAPEQEGVALLFEALKDFSYDRLEVAVDGPLAGELKVGVTLEGRNATVLQGYPIRLNVRVEGRLGEMIREGTVGYRIEERLRERLGDDGQ